MLAEFLAQIPSEEPIDTVTTNRAYGARALHTAVTTRETSAVIPTWRGRRPWTETTQGEQARNDILRAIRPLGRALRKTRSRCHHRSYVKVKTQWLKLLVSARLPSLRSALPFSISSPPWAPRSKSLRIDAAKVGEHLPSACFVQQSHLGERIEV